MNTLTICLRRGWKNRSPCWEWSSKRKLLQTNEEFLTNFWTIKYVSVSIIAFWQYGLTFKFGFYNQFSVCNAFAAEIDIYCEKVYISTWSICVLQIHAKNIFLYISVRM